MEQIGDMLILYKTEYKNNHQYYMVKCVKCGHTREVSKRNLQRKGNKHSSTVCLEDYFKEFIGRKLGDYTVIEYVKQTNQLKIKCNFCNSTRIVSECELFERFHNPSTCKEEYYKSYIGKIIGDFKVLDCKYNKRTGVYEIFVVCLKCNRQRWVRYKSLINGKVSHKDCIELLPKDEVTKTLKRRFENIIQRTNNPNNSNYHNYGGRGIKCEFDDFIEFYDFYRPLIEHDLTLTFDRIDVNGNYNYDNVRLIHHKEQQSNKQNTKYFLAYKDDEVVLCNNTVEFEKVFGVCGSSVRLCLAGKYRQAKGWIFENIDKEDFDKLAKSDDNGNVTTKLVV